MTIQLQTTEYQRLLKPTEVAALLGVTVATLEVWRCTNRYPLPYVKVGRSVRYEAGDVETFISKRKREHTGQSD